MEITRINPTKRWSDATIYNGIAHFVEIAEADPPGDIASQVGRILAQAEKRLAGMGSDKTRILSATIYLTDFANLGKLNEIWDSWFPQGTAPSRSCVKVGLADPALLVEMAFTAAAGPESIEQRRPATPRA